MLTLVIGDRNFSSWSLRPWLTARQAGLPFTEVAIRLDRSSTKEEILQYSPSGKVPCLIDDEGGKRLLIWDSLAICEYLAELVPVVVARRAGPASRGPRALRRDAFGIPATAPGDADGCSRQPAGPAAKPGSRCRYRAHRGHLGGLSQSLCNVRDPFLFGPFSIADAMYAPVVWRFLTYGVDLPPASQAWVQSMLTLPAMREWQAGALAEPL
jgi:glutathione S-transferase